jgi:hypothetical protein
MESKQATGIEIEAMIIAVGSFLYNTDNSICDIDSEFLENLNLLVSTELEKREAELH